MDTVLYSFFNNPEVADCVHNREEKRLEFVVISFGTYHEASGTTKLHGSEERDQSRII